MALIADSIYVQSVLTATSIRAGNASTMRINMGDFSRVAFHVLVGDCAGVAGTYSNWNGADGIETLKLEQHTAATGGSTKDIADFELNKTTADTGGNSYILECRSEDVDTEGGYCYVGLYAATTDNTGVDNITVTAIGLPRYASENVSGATDAI